MTRFVVPLGLAVLAAGCADAVTVPVAAAPRPEPDLVATLARKAEGVTVTTSRGLARGAVIWRCCFCSGRPPSPDEQPLIIIDGVVSDGSALRELRLNPGEVTDVQILKGPAAAERYGPAARNGVVLVRTSRSAARTGS